jgi:ubiquinone biosynthesis protein UbiJ
MKLLERAGEVDQLRREEEMLHSQLDRLKQEVGI